MRKMKNDAKQFRNMVSRAAVIHKINPETEGFQNIVATENPVVVMDWYEWKPVREILLMSGCVLPENKQIVLLDNHSRWEGTNAIKGSTRELTINGSALEGVTIISSTAEKEKTLVEEGHLTDTSVGYEIIEGTRIKPGASAVIDGRSFVNDYADGLDLVVQTSWRPFENSLTPIGADEIAKFKRNMFSDKEEIEIDLQGNLEDQVNNIKRENLIIKIKQNNPTGDIMTEEERKAALKEQNERVRAIYSIAQEEGVRRQLPGVDLTKEAQEYVEKCDTPSVSDFQARLFSLMKDKTPSRSADTEIGLSENEIRDYSVRKVVLAQITNDYSDVGLEMEASRTLSEKLGRKSKGIFIPDEIQKRRRSLNLSSMNQNERALVVGTPASGGFTVQNQYIPQSFIELVEQALLFLDNGNFVTGLKGNVPMTRELTGAQYYWGGEEDDITLSGGPTFGQETKSPHKLGARIKESYEFLTQSSLAVDTYVERKLARAAAKGFNKGIIYGTGQNDQITGLKLITGVGSVDGPGFNRAQAVEMEAQVIASGVTGSPKFYSNGATRGILKNSKIDNGSGLFLVSDLNTMLGYDYKGISNEIDAGDLIHGFFGELLLMYWNQLEILANPYGTGYAAGDVEVRALMGVDMFCNHPDAFSIAEGIA